MAVYEVVLEGRLDANDMLSILHYDITGSTAFQAFVDAIALLMIPDLTSLLVPSASYLGATIRLDTPGSVGTFYGFTGGAVTGANVVTGYWGATAANVRKLTTSGSRPAQGRIYQGGVNQQATNDDGAISAVYRADLADFWNQMRVITFDTLGTAEMVIKASNPAAPNTVPYNPVTSLDVAAKPGKQSRRNHGA